MRERWELGGMSPLPYKVSWAAPGAKLLQLLSTPLARIARMAMGLETAFRCNAIYNELSTLDDNALRRLGFARSDIPRVAAVAAGILSSRDRTAEAAQVPLVPERRNISRVAA